MKFLHTSDWHLGKIFHELSLKEDQDAFLSQIFSELKSADEAGDAYDALLVSGDIYDRAIPPTDAVRQFSAFLAKTHKQLPKLELFFLAGNHDSVSRLSFASEILADEKIHICTDTSHFTEPVIIVKGDEKAAVYQLPFLAPLSIAPGEKDPDAGGSSGSSADGAGQQELFGSASEESAEDEKKLRTQQELAAEACRRIKAAHDKEHADAMSVVCAHLFTASAHVSDSERSFVGTAEQVDAALFDDFTYTALGHLHKFQPCGKSGRVFYSGSPLAYSFDDVPETCMLRVEIHNGEAPSVTKLPFTPLHPLVRLEGPFSAFYGSNADRNLIELNRNKYVEIKCTDPVMPQTPVPLLRQNFPYILSFLQKTAAVSADTVRFELRRAVMKSSGENKSEKLFDLFINEIYGGQHSDAGLLAEEKKIFIKEAENYSWEEN